MKPSEKNCKGCPFLERRLTCKQRNSNGGACLHYAYFCAEANKRLRELPVQHYADHCSQTIVVEKPFVKPMVYHGEHGKSHYRAICPFCETENKIPLWCGKGKKCTSCGAELKTSTPWKLQRKES